MSSGFQRRNDYLFLPSEIRDLPQFSGLLVMPTLPTCQIRLSTDAQKLPEVPLPLGRSIEKVKPVAYPPLQLVEPHKPKAQPQQGAAGTLLQDDDDQDDASDEESNFAL